MNKRMTDINSYDAVDDLLKEWHAQNRERALQLREALRNAARRMDAATQTRTLPYNSQESGGDTRFAIKRAIPWRIAAAIALLASLAVILLPQNARQAQAQTLMLPNGGRLDAFDQNGDVVGPCALEHTDVDIEVSGYFARTTVRQQYHNPYDAKIEAVYTFPLPHDAAVDRMRMVIDGDRIVEGEVRERKEARQMYESARDAGFVAALLEQERPNIFTQNVANIEPGASIDIEISYIAIVEQRDGEFSLAFPMTVAPRYIPGYALPQDGRARGDPDVVSARLPEGLTFRRGVILQGPATFERVHFNVFDPADAQARFDTVTTNLGPAAYLDKIFDRAIPITDAGLNEWRLQPQIHEQYLRLPDFAFHAIYSDGSREFGQMSGEGLGHIAGRWFWVDPRLLEDIGLIGGTLSPALSQGERKLGAGPFAGDTDQVPDGSRITPMPMHPSTRAGHDIAIRVSIATGGPKITGVESELHEIEIAGNEIASQTVVTLTNEDEIPNRDFMLKWKLDDSSITESTFVHAGDDFEQNGGYVTLILAPPARVDAANVVAREIIFVLDTSGSMSGEPIAKAKSVLTSTIDAMRKGDTFNVITFSGHTAILWDDPQPNTDANRAEALAWINSRQGGGGTEMMAAIEAALNPQNGSAQAAAAPIAISLEDLANLPADRREVMVEFERAIIEPGEWWSKIAWGALRVREDLAIDWTAPSWEIVPLMDDESIDKLIGRGTWSTRDGRRYFDIHAVKAEASSGERSAASDLPMRLCVFLTDGEVGNDMAIIDAVKRYADTTRVFAFGVGNSVNRYLLATMAHAGRGEVEFVTQESERREAVERFVRRIESPVLTDITLELSDGLQVSDILPLTPGGYVPDLYDVQPLMVQGRYLQAGKGTLTIRGRTGDGDYERTIELDLPARAEEHDVIRTLWARKKVEELTNADLTGVQLGAMLPEQRQAIVDLAVHHQIMSQFTSFVAIEKSRITIDGKPVLVRIPIELPSDARWEGYFGSDGCVDRQMIQRAIRSLSRMNDPALHETGEVLVVELQHADATELAQELDIALSPTGAGRVPSGATAESLVVAIPERNAIAIPGTIAGQEKVARVIEELDRPSDDALRARISQMEDELRRLQEQGGAQWLTEQRAAEIRTLVEEALASADGSQRRFDFGGFENRRTALQLRYLPTVPSEPSFAWQAQHNRQLTLQRMPDFGHGEGSVEGLTQYPSDWPSLSIQRTRSVDTQFHLADYFDANGRVQDPLIFDSFSQTDEFSNQIALGQQFGIPAGNPPSDIAYITGPVGPPVRTTEGWSPVQFQQDSFNLVDLLGGFGSDAFAGTILSDNPALHGDIPELGADFRRAPTMDLDGVLAGRSDASRALQMGESETNRQLMVDQGAAATDITAMQADPEFQVFLIWLDGLETSTAGVSTFVQPPTMAPFHLLDLERSEATPVPQPEEVADSPEGRALQLLADKVMEVGELVNAIQESGGATPRAADALLMVFDPHDPAHQPFYVERAALAVADLVEASYIEEARFLASWIVTFAEAHGVASGELFDTLRAFPTGDGEEVNATYVEEVRSGATQAMEDQLERAIVRDTLSTRLSEELLQSWASWKENNESAGDALLVTILIEDASSRETIESLEGAGVDVEDVSEKMGIVVGRVTMDELERIALLPVVRKIERTRLDDESLED